MAEKLLRRIPEEKAATPDEVRTAIADLTTPNLLRLKKFASFRIRGLGRKACGRDGNDLRQEAVVDTLSGNRHWNKEAVDFVGHLLGAMRSISTHWGEQFDPDEARLESEVTRIAPQGKIRNPIDGIASATIAGERIISAKEEIEEIERIFAEDAVVSLIIEGLREGMTGPEIQDALGISQKEYDAAMKRMRRKVRGIEPIGRSDAQ